MDTEVFSVVKQAVMKVQVMNSVGLNLLGNRCRVLTQMGGDLFKGKSLIQGILDIGSVLKRKMLLVSGYQITHE